MDECGKNKYRGENLDDQYVQRMKIENHEYGQP
jgi:hypothetical protein